MAMEIQRGWRICKGLMKNISLLSGYLFLVIAIITGITSNGFLKTTEGFTKINPTIFCITSIIVCIFCLSKAMTVIPVGFTYATYGALTITAVTLFGVLKYNQTPNIYGLAGILLIIIGVILLNTLGKLK
jgi:small multidrug resistance pump